MVHRREVEGEAVLFGNQGALYGNAMTWWDHRTGSIWSQPLGEAIAGPLEGARLELLPSSLTSWRAWWEAHPETLALDVPAVASRFVLEQMAVVVDFGTEAAAYPIPSVREAGVVNDRVAGVPLAVWSDQQRWAVFSRLVDDTILELRLEGERLLDQEGTAWNPVSGAAVSGPRRGERLDPLPAFTSFPRDFPTFWPEGRIWEP